MSGSEDKISRWGLQAQSDFQRLEFLGDALLGAVVADELYRRWPDAGEGTLSIMRAELVCADTLAQIAEGLGRTDNSWTVKKKADCFEALVGAMFLDTGYEPCRRQLLEWMAEKLQALSPDVDYRHPKNRLQELLHSRGEETPSYTMANNTMAGNQDSQVCCTFVLNGKKQTVPGLAHLKQDAETQAAERALQMLQAEGFEL